MHKICRNLLFILSFFCFFFAAVPVLTYGVSGAGTAVLVFSGIILLFYAGLGNRLHARRRRVMNVLLAVGAACVFLLTGLMVRAAYFSPPASDDSNVTVIVLGCQIRGDRPSLMLSRRLQAAAAYLKEKPEALVIVSGGQGADEEYAESEIMKRYLVELGIEETRILEEDRSLNTQQNLKYSAGLIRQKGLSTRVVIATDGFHQLRAAKYAKNNGLTPSAVNARTPWELVPVYYVREYLAIVKAVLVGGLLW